ncbi:MAG TPA: TrbI/VirB10 family protein [Allosphingosinicella sp.]|nr:TrbI/VirB10 family protein [Allosphingosinicella sp.]
MATRRPPPRDPRVPPPGTGEESVKPVVPLPRSGPSPLIFAIAAVVAAVLLFSLLDARRRALTAPSTRERAADQLAVAAPPPPLYVPREIPPAPVVVTPVPAPAPAPPPAAPVPPQIVYVPQPAPAPAPAAEAPPPRIASSPALVFDSGAPATAAEGAPTAAAEAENAPAAAAGTAIAGTRTRAGVLANRSTTVVQGTLIPAVLETALDSTRAGLARAIVQRDVRSFDGTRVLIPRGSRLIGEYRSEAQPGQNRALVNWFRLIRPDGITIAIGSPAGDPLGRGGIRANVNSHFFQRFAGALLQSALDIGVNLAASRAGGNTVVVLPGTIQNSGATQIVQPQQITPTLTVRQGTSISIFVARDLDFTGAGARR